MPETVSFQYPPIWKVLNRGKPYEPFWYQAQHIHAQVDAGKKRIICAWGRRAGKSSAVVAEVAREVVKEPELVKGVEHSPIVYVIGPNAEASMRIWEPVWAAFVPPDDGSYIPPLGFLHDWHDKSRGVIGIKGGARIYRKTGESPASIQGERVTLIIMDESQDMPEDVYQYAMPGLLESGGRLIAIGVAKGRGRFRTYWHLGQGEDSMYHSSVVASTESPVIQQLAREAGIPVIQWLRENTDGDLTDVEFRQQYLAEWIDADGQVFTNYERLFTGTGGSPLTGGPFIASLDLGKVNDFTVLYVGDISKQEFVAKWRFNKVDYLDQMPRIINVLKGWGVRFVHMDANGVGAAPAEMLRAAQISVVEFPWSNQSKQALVSSMVRAVERGEVKFLRDDEDLKKEMGLFEGTVSPGGVIKYSAPPGYHDDCVISAALLIQKMAKNKAMAQSPLRGSYFAMSTKRPGTGRRRVTTASRS